MAKTKKTTAIKAKKTKKVKPAAKAKTAPKKKPAAEKKSQLVKGVRKTAKSEIKTQKSLPGYGSKELEHFKQIIVEKRREILDDLETLRNTMMDNTTGEYASENPSYSLHMEQGTDAMEREKTFLFASREGKFLNYLDDALSRIEKGTYGRCSVCEKLIEKERLEAVPHAQMCFKCKSASK